MREDLQAASQPGRLFDDLLELLPKGDWITPKAAAAFMGYDDVDSFRRAYCDRKAPRVRMWQRPGPGGGRRVFIDRDDLRQLVASGLVEPA